MGVGHIVSIGHSYFLRDRFLRIYPFNDSLALDFEFKTAPPAIASQLPTVVSDRTTTREGEEPRQPNLPLVCVDGATRVPVGSLP